MALFRKPSAPQDDKEWTPRDASLMLTVHAMQAALAGDLSGVPRIPTPFALQSGQPHERTVATAPFQLWSWQALSDGSYYHDQSAYFAMGRGAVGFTLGAMAGRTIGNSHRARRAAEDAQPRWVPIEHGQLTVSDHGFYLHTPRTVLWWNWQAISLAQLTAPATVQIMGDSATGPVNWLLTSDVAELVFSYWALVRNRHHPQLLDGVWMPWDWVQRVERLWGRPQEGFPHESVLRWLNT